MKSNIYWCPEPRKVEIELTSDLWAEWMAGLFDQGPAPQTLEGISSALSCFHAMLAATPDDLLAQWPEQTRRQVAEAAREWARRLDPRRPAAEEDRT